MTLITRHLEIIYDAYDRIYAIARHRWDSMAYYHEPTKTSNLFGHYVRALMPDRDPATITWAEWEETSGPLKEAIDAMLQIIFPADPSLKVADIVKGYHPTFRHLTPYERAVRIFWLIEKHYPRRIHRTPLSKDANRSSRRRSSKAYTKNSSSKTDRHARRGDGVPGVPGVPSKSQNHPLRWLPYKD